MKRLIRTSTYIRSSKEIDFGESCPFKRTTDTSYYDNFLNDKDLKYMQNAKNRTGEIVMMSPNEYIEQCANVIFHGRHTVDQIVKSRRYSKNLDTDIPIVTEYAEAMKSGSKFPLCYLNYAEDGQEGLHRMIAAGDAYGFDTKFPVLVIKPFDEDVSNPETQRVLREMIAEMHENFGKPPYFHIGCDEANVQSCPECTKTPNHELVVKHIAGLSEYVKSIGARAMIWHDMFLEKKDPRWKGFVKNGSDKAPQMLEALPKDIIICDWQYSYGNMSEVRKDWPTIGYFKEKGFDVAGCPWMNYNAMKPMADYLVANGGFGLIETTWHRMSGKNWEKMFLSASHAAWGSPVSHGVSFERSLRMIGRDMKLTDYLDTGHNNNQVPFRWTGD